LGLRGDGIWVAGVTNTLFQRMAELSCDRTAGGDCHSLRDGIARQLSDSPWHLEDSAWTAGEYVLFAVMIVSMVRFYTLPVERCGRPLEVAVYHR